MKKFIKIERHEGKIEKEDKRVESKTVTFSCEKRKNSVSVAGFDFFITVFITESRHRYKE